VLTFRPSAPTQTHTIVLRQVSDWFTNWRARHWKPRVQQMASEMGGGGGSGGGVRSGSGGGSEGDTE